MEWAGDFEMHAAAEEDVTTIHDALDALSSAEISEENLEHMNRIPKVPGGIPLARRVAETLTNCWKRSDEFAVLLPAWRARIIAVASIQCSSNELPSDILLAYVELGSEACAWCCNTCTVEDDYKAQAKTFDLISSIFCMETLRQQRFDVLKLFMQAYAEFFKSVSFPESQHELTNGIVKAISSLCKRFLAKGSATKRDAVQLVVTGIQSLIVIGKAAGKTVSVTAWRCAIELIEAEAVRVAAAPEDMSMANVIKDLIFLSIRTLKQASSVWFKDFIAGDTFESSEIEKGIQGPCRLSRFYLMNAVRLSSVYPSAAISIQQEFVAAACQISAALLALSNGHPVLKSIATVLSETVAPSALGLVHMLLTSKAMNWNAKVKLLNLVTPAGEKDDDDDAVMDVFGEDMVDVIRTANAPRQCAVTGHVAVFVNLLQVSAGFEKEVVRELARRIDWLLESLPELPVYVNLFQSKLVAGKPSAKQQQQWKLLYLSIMQALETLACNCAKVPEAWEAVEGFLYRNTLHPFAVCREMVVDLWCFILRNSSESMAKCHLEALHLLFLQLASAKLIDWYRLKGFARAISKLVEASSSITTNSSVAVWFSEKVLVKTSFASSSQASATVVSLLLEEKTFPFGRLRRSIVSQFVDSCLDAIAAGESNSEAAISSLIGILSQRDVLQAEDKVKISRVLTGTVKSCGSSRGILSRALIGLSLLEEAMDVRNIEEVLRELTGKQIRVELIVAVAKFLASLSEVSMEASGVEKMQEVYRVVLRQRHWGLVHCGLDSFGYFAARTDCDELWRFVPSDAAMAFDDSGVRTAEDGFMIALKLFLEREGAKASLKVTEDEVEKLMEECSSQQRFLPHGQPLRQPQPQSSSSSAAATAAAVPVMSEMLAFEEAMRELKSKVLTWNREEREVASMRLGEAIGELVRLQETMTGEEESMS